MEDNKIMADVIDLTKHAPMSLQEACEAHRRFMDKYMLKKLNITSLDNLTDADRTRLTKEFLLCILSELSETLNGVGWKHWKDYSTFKQNRFETKFELADIQLFLFAMYHVWGMTPQEAGHIISAKIAENIRRQEEGY